MKRISASERLPITSRPCCMSSFQSSGGGSRVSRLASVEAIEWMGASELLSSWPSTRISRFQAWRSSSRRVWERSEITSRRWGRPRFAEGAAPDLPAPRAAGEGEGEGARDLAVEQAGEPQVLGRLAQQALAGLGEQPLAGAVDQPELAVVVEGEDGDVHLVDDAVEERGGLDGAQPLLAQHLADRVDLVDHLRQRVGLLRLAGAQREVPLAQGGEEVGERLQRPHDAVAELRGEPPPEEDPEQGHRPAELEGVRVEPDEEQGEQRPRQAGGQRQQEEAVLEGERPAPAGAQQAAEGERRAAGGSEAMLLEPPVEGAAREAQRLGGLADVMTPSAAGFAALVAEVPSPDFQVRM